jgi:hypothetical protein
VCSGSPGQVLLSLGSPVAVRFGLAARILVRCFDLYVLLVLHLWNICFMLYLLYLRIAYFAWPNSPENLPAARVSPFLRAFS